MQDGVKCFATTSRVGEQRNREKEWGTNVRECQNEKGFIKNRCRHPGPHFRFVSWPTSNFYDASNSRRDSSIFQMKTLFYSNSVKWTDCKNSLTFFYTSRPQVKAIKSIFWIFLFFLIFLIFYAKPAPDDQSKMELIALYE